jgi:hypothetical protein
VPLDPGQAGLKDGVQSLVLSRGLVFFLARSPIWLSS